MATSKATPKGRANPLGGIAKKPASYVGDLDDLLDRVADEPAPSDQNPPPQEGRAKAPPRKKAIPKKEMKRSSSEEDVPRSRINLLLPADLHRQFKIRTTTEGVTMTSVLEAFIRDYVAQ